MNNKKEGKVCIDCKKLIWNKSTRCRSCSNKIKKGTFNSESHKGFKRESHPNWKGNKVGYKAFHFRVVSARGSPKLCEVCGTTTAKRYDWANLTGDYTNLKDYKRMCRSCHFKFDKRKDK